MHTYKDAGAGPKLSHSTLPPQIAAHLTPSPAHDLYSLALTIPDAVLWLGLRGHYTGDNAGNSNDPASMSVKTVLQVSLAVYPLLAVASFHQASRLLPEAPRVCRLPALNAIQPHANSSEGPMRSRGSSARGSTKTS
eukprot:Tamp_30599.p1 GENE.Tamp_30599~~Tamp_30599.p1  ORF type:complete len:137 (-),score=0.90 Tamp_30599:30-440(-)